jgi:prepilin-type N-terminal cleavage/methylation domain-containing protein
MNPRSSQISSLDRGFTLVELVVAAAIATAIITVAVIAFRTLSMSPRTNTVQGDVTLGTTALHNFYPNDTGATLTTPFAPSYGTFMLANQTRDAFYEDLRYANAVFCLGRNGLNTVRPGTISVGSTFQGRAVATPNDFLTVLSAAYPDAATIFQTYRGASTATNGTIFILAPSGSADTLLVRAIYEIDLLPVTSPAGVYACVRRYVNGGELDSNYSYRVFYPAETAAGSVELNPLFVAFERAARADEGDDTVDRIKVAAGRPFYFVWWPDPSQPSLNAASSDTFASSEPRASYPAMSGRSSFFFVIPMMPAL